MTNYVVLGFGQTGSVLTHYLNGGIFGSGTMNAMPADAETPLKIGTRDDFVTHFKGDLAELLIYGAALTPLEVDGIEQYLGAKYGIPIVESANLPPMVAISTPADGAAYVAPTNVTVTATANDTDGSVVRVEFLEARCET